MDVQDGFVVGIFNYCDRWCETCAFTSRCRLFADVAELEARADPELRVVVDAPPHPLDMPPPPPPPRWMQELIAEANEAAAANETLDWTEPRMTPEHDGIEARAMDHSFRVHVWLDAHDSLAVRDPRDPAAVVAWFHTMISAKVHRALRGLAADDPEDRSWPADFDGSAKVALLSIERSHTAWLQLVDGGRASRAEIDLFLADLVWLGEAIERKFPNARAFVRPAFDEPDEVATLLASEGLD